MINEFTHKGVWFLPGSPHRKETGILRFDTKSDSELDLFGGFLERQDEFHEANFILGITNSGKYITLYNCAELSRSNTNGRVTSSKYSVFYVFIGAHFCNDQEFRFNQISVKFKNLGRWIKKYGFKIENDFPNKYVKIEYKQPDDISFRITEQLKGKLSFNSWQPITSSTEEIEITQSAFYELESDAPLHFTDILDNAMQFQNFLTLATFEPTYPISVHVKINYQTDEETDVQVIYKPGFNYIPEGRGKAFFLFFYPDVEKEFEGIIQKWYGLKGTIEPVISLLLNSFYIKEQNFINRFLAMIQALETFHRRLKNYKKESEEVYNSWKENLVNLVDEKYKEMLSGLLTHGNEPSLRARMNGLIKALSVETINKLVDKTFVNRVLETRNYYTHYDTKLEDKALTGNDLYQITDKLRVILIGSILLESGFSIDKINELLKRAENRFFNHLIKTV